MATHVSMTEEGSRTAIFEKNAKIMSKYIPAKTHSLSLLNLFGISNMITPKILNTPRMYIKCAGYPNFCVMSHTARLCVSSKMPLSPNHIDIRILP